MPVETGHPGVYVEEVPSGVHTIVGVSTSVTAFVGATRMGPVGKPVRIRNLPQFTLTFGAPIDAANPLAYCVAHFFANGGSEAIIVRTARGNATTAAAVLKDEAGHNLIELAASSPGSWATRAGGTGLEVSLKPNAAAGPDRFDLTVALYGIDPRSGVSVVVDQEGAGGLTMAPGDPRFVGTALTKLRLLEATLPTPPEVHGFIRGKAALPGTLVFKPDNNILKIAVDGDPPVELPLFATQLEANAETTQTRSAVVNELNSVLAPLKVKASLDSGEFKEFLLLTSETTGGNSAVTVSEAAANDAGLLELLGGAAVSGAVELLPAATAAPVPFAGGDDKATAKGLLATSEDIVPAGGEGGLFALGELLFPRFNLLCLPGLTTEDGKELGEALAYCKEQRALLIADTPPEWQTDPPDVGLLPALGEHGALYYPRLSQSRPAPGGVAVTLDLPPCGVVAGAIARTDAERGIWKSPAGREVGLVGFDDLSVPTDDALSDLLNPRGVNALRTFPGAGAVIWGARTLKGDDTASSEFKYIAVRRMTDYVAKPLYLGTQFAVFEPNDPDLWAQLRLAVGTFMRGLFRKGAFQQSTGRAESDSFFVICDDTVNPQAEIDLGRVNVAVGFAPLKPAEFVVITITQISQLEA